MVKHRQIVITVCHAPAVRLVPGKHEAEKLCGRGGCGAGIHISVACVANYHKVVFLVFEMESAFARTVIDKIPIGIVIRAFAGKARSVFCRKISLTLVFEHVVNRILIGGKLREIELFVIGARHGP